MTVQSRLRKFGWLALLLIGLAVFIMLSFQTHAVRSEVQFAEREIIALEREAGMLETEFQTRASQRQLSDWNAVEFGYSAPRADQYLENERQLASLGSSELPDAPTPLRVARTVSLAAIGGETEEMPALTMVSPITGKPVTLEVAATVEGQATLSESLGELLAKASPVREARAAEVGE